MGRELFIGDIHGCCETFKKLIERIELNKSDTLYFVGDYIDRGPDSKGVIDYILELREKGYSLHTLRGNHEQMMLDSLKEGGAFDLWMLNGGESTLESFGISSAEGLDRPYMEFFSQTPHYVKTDKFIVVHAGLNFYADDPLADKDSMIWIRNFAVDRSYLNGRLLIHGHTPMDRESVVSQEFEGPVNIDGGCVYGKAGFFGSLFALDLTGKEFIEVKNID